MAVLEIDSCLVECLLKYMEEKRLSIMSVMSLLHQTTGSLFLICFVVKLF